MDAKRKTNFTPRLIVPPKEHSDFFFPNEDLDISIGCVGHVRGDFGRNGGEFWTTWWGRNDSLNTPEFKKDIDATINWLRADGLLKDLNSMREVCLNNKESLLEISHENNYGFRCDSDSYCYYIRAMLNKGDYNFYVYAYQRDKLETHLSDKENKRAKESL